jgi:hypothetical protein
MAIKYENFFEVGLIFVKIHLLCRLEILSDSGLLIQSQKKKNYTGNKIFITTEIAIKAPEMPKIISGFTFIPFVSSSKNLNNPALEAGNGAFFFAFLLIYEKSKQANKYISVFIYQYSFDYMPILLLFIILMF